MAMSSSSVLSNTPGAFQSLVEKKLTKQLVPLLFQPQEDQASRNLALSFYINFYVGNTS